MTRGLFSLFLVLAAPLPAAELKPETTQAFDRYAARNEARIESELGRGISLWIDREPPSKRQELLANVPTADRPSRIYPSLDKALERFRLMPPQPAENYYVLDFIARRSLKKVPMPDGSGEGWTWKFDPNMWEKLDRELIAGFFAAPPRIDLPLAHVYGELSLLMSIEGLQDAYPQNGLLVGVPQAHHHVMVDQPLALVAAIRGLLAAWRA